MSLTSRDFDDLITILTTLQDWQSEQSRRDLLEDALKDSPRKRDVMGGLDLSGAPRGTALRILSRLSDFGQDIPGRPILCLLLSTLHRYTGASDQIALSRISATLACPIPVSPVKGDSLMLPPETLAIGIPFLFEIGRWAKSELSEIWGFRRKAQEIELSKVVESQSDKQALESLLNDTAQDLGENQVKRVLNLIIQNHDLILDQEQRAITARQQFNLGNMTKFVLDNIEKDVIQEKKKLLEEIKRLAEGIGLTSVKE